MIPAVNQNRVVQRSADGWDGVPVEGYRPGAAPGVERHTIIGGRKENAEAGGPSMELRYFRLQPGTTSRLEKHEHEHYVIIGEGQGHAIVGDRVWDVAAQDVVYVGPLEPHQFLAKGDAPFGFFCIVSSERDYSQALSPEELAHLAASAAGPIVRPDGAPRPRYEREANLTSV